MTSKLLIASILLIVVGLALLVYTNTYIRVETGTTPGFTGVTTFARTGTFTGFPGNFTGFGNFTRTAGEAARGALTTNGIESLVGLGLVAGGVILEVFSLFLRPNPLPRPKAEPPT